MERKGKCSGEIFSTIEVKRKEKHTWFSTFNLFHKQKQHTYTHTYTWMVVTVLWLRCIFKLLLPSFFRFRIKKMNSHVQCSMFIHTFHFVHSQFTVVYKFQRQVERKWDGMGMKMVKKKDSLKWSLFSNRTHTFLWMISLPNTTFMHPFHFQCVHSFFIWVLWSSFLFHSLSQCRQKKQFHIFT